MPGGAQEPPRAILALLRAEGAAAAAAATLLYARLDFGWALFALLVLAPDLSLLGKLGSRRLGDGLYDAAHTYLAPALLAALAAALGWQAGLGAALVWVVHIGADRALGFGLKLPGAARATHLRPAGR